MVVKALHQGLQVSPGEVVAARLAQVWLVVQEAIVGEVVMHAKVTVVLEGSAGVVAGQFTHRLCQPQAQVATA